MIAKLYKTVNHIPVFVLLLSHRDIALVRVKLVKPYTGRVSVEPWEKTRQGRQAEIRPKTRILKHLDSLEGFGNECQSTALCGDKATHKLARPRYSRLLGMVTQTKNKGL